MQGYIYKLAIKELGQSLDDLSPFLNITNSRNKIVEIPITIHPNYIDIKIIVKHRAIDLDAHPIKELPNDINGMINDMLFETFTIRLHIQWRINAVFHNLQYYPPSPYLWDFIQIGGSIRNKKKLDIYNYFKRLVANQNIFLEMTYPHIPELYPPQTFTWKRVIGEMLDELRLI